MKNITAYLKLAGVALAAYAITKAAQENVMNVPIVGQYLPGYTPR